MDIVRELAKEIGHPVADYSGSAEVETSLLVSAKAEILMLRERVKNAEISLAVYDNGNDSEYWLIYPKRMKF